MSQTYQNAFILQSFGLDQPNPPQEPVRDPSEPKIVGVHTRPVAPHSEYKPGCPPKVKYDEHGQETYEWAWYQSVERLRSSWEGIVQRYSEAHIEDQDEIYLGRPNVPGDEPRLIRDRGSIRSLQTRSDLDDFFHKDLPHYEFDENQQDFDEHQTDADAQQRKEDPDTKQTNSHIYESLQNSPSHFAWERRPSGPSTADPAADSKPWRMRAFDEHDSDLQEFLRQEARRREILGDEMDDVVDLGAEDMSVKFESQSSTERQLNELKRSSTTPAPRLASSPDPDIAVELDIYRSVKREAVDQLLRSNTIGHAPIPYDIPGLSEMLAAD
ncbi:hypothetical protein MYAM1_002033 [Malassezia yamatoensis]|uniref:Uncharacterized protein n=1 Tax=Malassezia yamatoensis TaxID=253288 RepID=A0AAJ5YRU5_9BASI|nr:hypothetical protein MYAM1_002033 [Malassezia yamatoensis]